MQAHKLQHGPVCCFINFNIIIVLIFFFVGGKTIFFYEMDIGSYKEKTNRQHTQQQEVNIIVSREVQKKSRLYFGIIKIHYIE